nr:adenylosuccinate synthetase [Pyrinomonadaceae bacterium]
EIEGETIDTFPAVSHGLGKIKPIYETLKGWETDTLGTTKIEDLPENARKYVEFLSNSIGVEIGLISTGPERDQTIILQDSVMESWFKSEKMSYL